MYNLMSIMTVMRQHLHMDIRHGKDIIVQGNPRVYKALKDEMQKILVELQRISDASDMNQDLLEIISLVTETMSGMKEGCE